MNLTEDILKVLQESSGGQGQLSKQDAEFVKKHKVQVVDDPEQEDPKVASGAPKPKVPKGQGAKGVKITDVEEYDGKKIDPKKEDDVKQAKAKQPKGKGIKGFKEAYDELETPIAEKKESVIDLKKAVVRHQDLAMKANKKGGKEAVKFHQDKIKSLRKQAAASEEKLDPVNKKAAAKDFDDRKDKDIDNDGDVDSSDKYLHKRRKAISKATNEAVNPAKFVKGGDFKVKKNDVDSLLSKLFGNQKLSKEIEKNKAYKAGYKGGKNPYKKDTADFHLFILGQQAKSAE